MGMGKWRHENRNTLTHRNHIFFFSNETLNPKILCKRRIKMAFFLYKKKKIKEFDEERKMSNNFLRYCILCFLKTFQTYALWMNEKNCSEIRMRSLQCYVLLQSSPREFPVSVFHSLASPTKMKYNYELLWLKFLLSKTKNAFWVTICCVWVSFWLFVTVF